MEDVCCHEPRKSFREALDEIEADVEHANALACVAKSLKERWCEEMRAIAFCGNRLCSNSVSIYSSSYSFHRFPQIILFYQYSLPLLPFLSFVLPSGIVFMPGHNADRAAAIPRAKSGTHLEMKLVYNDMAPLLLHLIQWMECSCSCISPRYLNLSYIVICKVYEDGAPKMSARARKASINDFYGIILPSLEQLHSDMTKLDGTNANNLFSESTSKKIQEKDGESACSDPLKDGECGICLVAQAEIVLPDCYHSMCSNCYYKWISRSESCPFCRDNLEGLEPIDLWYLTNKVEVADPATVFAEDLQNFCLYIKNLRVDLPEVMFQTYNEYLI